MKNNILEKTARNGLSKYDESGYIKQEGNGASTFNNRLKKQ